MRIPHLSLSRVAALPIALFFLWSAASAQTLEGRFYPEKETYLVGEPIIIIAEITNPTEETFSFLGGSSPPEASWPYKFVIEHGPPPKTERWGCWRGGTLGGLSGFGKLMTQEKYNRRFLLNKSYHLKEAGRYEVLASGKFPYWPESLFLKGPSEEVAFQSRFEIFLEPEAEEGEVEAFFQPFVAQLKSRDPDQRDLAFTVVTEMAPPFLEDVILGLARGPKSRWDEAVRALWKLNTQAARKTLAGIAEKKTEGNWETVRYEAIKGLAFSGDRAYLPLLQRLARQAETYPLTWAIPATGRLGGDDMIPFLLSFLQNPNLKIRYAAICGLGSTASPRAVPILIGLLRDQDSYMRQQTEIALTLLTHRTSRLNLRDATQAADSVTRWEKWWTENEGKAKLYFPEDYTTPRPLD